MSIDAAHAWNEGIGKNVGAGALWKRPPAYLTARSRSAAETEPFPFPPMTGVCDPDPGLLMYAEEPYVADGEPRDMLGTDAVRLCLRVGRAGLVLGDAWPRPSPLARPTDAGIGRWPNVGPGAGVNGANAAPRPDEAGAKGRAFDAPRAAVRSMSSSSVSCHGTRKRSSETVPWALVECELGNGRAEGRACFVGVDAAFTSLTDEDLNGPDARDCDILRRSLTAPAIVDAAAGGVGLPDSSL